MRFGVIALAIPGILFGCDEPKDNPIQRGQSYVDQARDSASLEFDQKIALVRSMIQANKLTDAQNLLDQLSRNEASLPKDKQETLETVKRELRDAS